MAGNTVIEREVKLETPIGLALPDLRHLVGGTVRLPEEHLVTQYFDTTDRRIWQQRMTLRHRGTGDGGDGTWTLKLPHTSEGEALQRTEVTWSGPSHEIPADASNLLRGVVRREPLRQLTTLKTTRRRLMLHDNQEHELAELDDDLVLVVGGPRDGARFRQVELELRDRTWSGDRVLRLLERAGARVETQQKLAKAIHLPEPPLSRDHPIDHRSSLADVVRVSLRSGLDRLVAHDWQLRLAFPEPKARDIHQARVATRRLRSDLKSFGAVLDPFWLRHVRSDLKWLGGALGQLRDLDVLSDGLSDPPLAVRQRLAVQRVQAARQLAEILAGARYLDLLDRLHAAAELLPLAATTDDDADRPAAEAMPPLVAARWRAVRKQVRRAGPDPSAAQLHRIRIKSKQLRYAAEAASPVIGKPARRLASAAEHLQTVLGKHHDAVTAEAWLREEWIGDGSIGTPFVVTPSVSFEVGRLVAEVRRRQRRTRRDWPDELADLRKPKLRRWFHRH
ncbi:MAG TPA: CYTH and CHAD domain-containing protein [Acidimicrobiales bacterium]|jgi:CHAD domain-containing protein|nr:CYTH and CHAD domain-containing protein [Acidimicrobiales bacterium]